MAILAGKFINFGLVDASSCADKGLLENGAASPCGENVARNAVILWQNQFDQAILEASQQAGVPPFVIKNVIILESQLWPSSFPTIYGYSEYGLGHITQMGADTLLRWNTGFYNDFCIQVFSPDTCRERYALLPANQQAVLRGAVIRVLDADCSNCPGMVNMKKARASIFTIASVLKANRRHTEWVIEGITGKPAAGRIEEVHLWRFTIAGYNAGPGCLANALYSSNRGGLSFSWKNVSSQFDKGCAQAIKYVDKVTGVYTTTPEILANASTDTSRAAAIVFAVAPHLQSPTTPTPTAAATATPPITLDPVNSAGNTEIPDVTSEPVITVVSPTESEVTGGEGEPPVTETPVLQTEIPGGEIDPITTSVPPTSTGGEHSILAGSQHPPLESDTAEAVNQPVITEAPPGASGEINPTQTSTESLSTAQNNPGEIILKFNGFIADLFAENVIDSVGATVEREVETLNVIVIKVLGENIPAVLDELNNNLLVDYAEPNFTVSAFYTPNDPEFPGQLYLGNIQVPEAWDHVRGAGVIVAVLDTGMALTHPDLAGANWINIGEFGPDDNGLKRQSNGLDDDENGYVDDWFGWNFVDDNNSVFDDHGHGTHVAGLIAAHMDNNLGIAGLAPEATIMPLKVLDASGQGSYAEVAAAITYAVDNGANIINLGLGGTSQSDTLKAAVDYAESHGVLVVAAAGNSGGDTLIYPASYPYVLSAGAVNDDLVRASFSTYGSGINLVAPGTGIYSTLLDNTYGMMSGTSMSSAQVSGVAALLSSLPQFDTANKVRSALLGSAHDLGDPGWDMYYGDGLVHALDALNFVSNGISTPTFSPPPVATSGSGTGEVNAMASEQLWGTAQSCTYAITNPENSIDLSFNNQIATCTGTFASTPGAWVYTTIQDTTLPSIASAFLNIHFGATIGNDTISLDVYDGAGWTSVATFNTNTPFALYTYDVSTILDTTTKVNAAQVRLLGTNRQGLPDTITITMDEILLAVSDTINTAPSVNITAPTNGSSFPQGASVTFTGIATDAEDGILSVNLQWASSIDGAIATGASFSTSSLSVGMHTITAQVTDSGGATGNASITVTITVVTNTAPTVSITSPANGSSFAQGVSITFTGTANDAQDGNISIFLQWTSSIDGAIGFGSIVSASSLSVGVHTITAQVTDSGGLTGNDYISITVSVSATSPHGDYGALTDQCALCHRTHTAETNRLISFSISPLTSNAFCLSCHNSGAVTVSTHSNIDNPSTQENFELLCVQCHEPHGNSNLANVRSNVRVQQIPSIITTGSVVFTSLTGTDSFDEYPDDGSSVDDICVTCHINPNRPGSGTALAHTGGANHNDGADFRGQDCTSCHMHSLDSDPNTRDGFMPGNGICRGCHSVTAGARRVIAGASGDFARSSHHVTGNDAVTDADCEVCHNQSAHQAGTVRLFNADNAGTVYALDGTGDATDYENFCSSCHDGNGAQKEIFPLAPFSDAVAPPTVATNAWSSASHNVSASVGSCVNCHDNGHGSNKVSLLAPWNYINDGNADDPMQQEERFCYTCHGAAGPATTNIDRLFSYPVNWVDQAVGANSNMNLNDRHDVQRSTQLVSDAKIECTDCHNPHADNSTLKVKVDPDPDDARIPGSGYYSDANNTLNFISDWCLDCHDGTMPATITQPTVTLFNVDSSMSTDQMGGNNSRARLDTGYGYGLDYIINCTSCHGSHVQGLTPITNSTNYFSLRIRTLALDGTTQIPTDGNHFDYEVTSNLDTAPDNISGWNWCNTCHVGSMSNSNCYRCHYHGTRW
jgi:thermitase